MKITVVAKAEKKTPEYPCFKFSKNDGTLVLFTAPGRGTLIFKGPSEPYAIGSVHNDWNEHRFEPFYGTIKIEKD